MLTFICYPKCSTCRKAQALLDSHSTSYTTRDIKTETPTYDELKSWFALSELPIKSFFNTSGLSYKSMSLKDKLPAMSEDECLRLLATDSMLIKRPLLISEDNVLVGFKHDEWESALTDIESVPCSITIDMTDSNDIHFPSEWCMGGKFGASRFVEITLVDDRIVIHEPTSANTEYSKPCKVGDNSYIRAFRLFSVCVPKQFFEKLGIKSGDKIDLSLEENCISIRKNIDVTQKDSFEQSEPPEPIMAFCCICGHLLYTENSLVKVSSKYICHGCIDAVKAL